ncbi:Hypothetical_protein [Hexamita inflata]|uniref:Hypothetical_protein n=1 Tax=Hexamita inflata TaxID=28002 RepID=A0AA86Q102_9EUKA|nr:Hypothetical protein HINF_LOCUS35228 [Hexamita inflata]
MSSLQRAGRAQCGESSVSSEIRSYLCVNIINKQFFAESGTPRKYFLQNIKSQITGVRKKYLGIQFTWDIYQPFLMFSDLYKFQYMSIILLVIQTSNMNTLRFLVCLITVSYFQLRTIIVV